MDTSVYAKIPDNQLKLTERGVSQATVNIVVVQQLPILIVTIITRELVKS